MDAGSTIVAQLVAYARQIHPTLDKLTYYQLLRVSPNDNVAAVRASYYRMAAQLHPDRYHTLPDRTAREQLESIYARINEGYRVLSSPDKRAMYDKGLPQGKMRFDFSDRAPTGPKSPEDTISHPQSKKFFRLGMLCLGTKDWKGAVMNFNFAKTFEANSPAIAEKLAEAQAGLKGAPPPAK